MNSFCFVFVLVCVCGDCCCYSFCIVGRLLGSVEQTLRQITLKYGRWFFSLLFANRFVDVVVVLFDITVSTLFWRLRWIRFVNLKKSMLHWNFRRIFPLTSTQTHISKYYVCMLWDGSIWFACRRIGAHF